jgi:transcriptional regulator with XRE-family HTH domain
LKYVVDFKKFRRQNNFTQVQAAEYFGCDQSFISQIENGRSPVPFEYIDKILADDNLDKSALSAEDDREKNMLDEQTAIINKHLALLAKKDEQIDRLLNIIENFNK